MKKMLFSVLASAILVLGLAGCDQTSTPGSTSTGGGSDTPSTSEDSGYSDTVLADNTHSAWVVAGNFLLSDNTTPAQWSYLEAAEMTATSVKAVSEISTDVADELASKSLRYLYMYKDVHLGTYNAGWNADAMKDGKKVNVLGSYAIKAIQCDYDAEEELWNSTQWISDPHTAHAESLTPSTLFTPPFVEEADENGFSWSSNPVCIGGAGTYTVVVAQYSTAADANTPNFGFALIKTAEEQEFVPPVVEEHTWGIIGSFDSWASDYVTLTRVTGENAYQGELTTAAGDEFKIRADGAWTLSYGSESLAEGTTAFQDKGGNIETVTAGTYTVTLTLDDVSAPTTATISFEAKVA